MMNIEGKILVVALKGTKCPKEGKPRDYITDEMPEVVLPSMFYLRLIRDGSLFQVEPPAKKSAASESDKQK